MAALEASLAAMKSESRRDARPAPAPKSRRDARKRGLRPRRPRSEPRTAQACGKSAELTPQQRGADPARPVVAGRDPATAGSLFATLSLPVLHARHALPDESTNAPTGASGLYDPANEHDACGIALVAKLWGEASHAVVEKALIALENLEHRGAEGADPNTGDGAGHPAADPGFVLPRRRGRRRAARARSLRSRRLLPALRSGAPRGSTSS